MIGKFKDHQLDDMSPESRIERLIFECNTALKENTTTNKSLPAIKREVSFTHRRLKNSLDKDQDKISHDLLDQAEQTLIEATNFLI